MRAAVFRVSRCAQEHCLWTDVLAILAVVVGEFHSHLLGAVDSVAEMLCTMHLINMPSLHAATHQMCNSRLHKSVIINAEKWQSG